MKVSTFLLLLFLVTAAFHLKAADGATAERFPLLTRLTPSEAILPSGCSIAKGGPPVEGLQNQSITTNSRAIVFMDDALTELVRTNIEAMYYAVYEEKAEIGIFGWAFKTEEDANQARDTLAEKYGDRSKTWLSQKCLVCLWHDRGATDECFEFVEAFLQKRVDGLAAVGSQ